MRKKASLTKTIDTGLAFLADMEEEMKAKKVKRLLVVKMHLSFMILMVSQLNLTEEILEEKG